MKATVKSYFRYHHFSTHPAMESHSNFMTCLNMLEAYADKTLANGFDTKENWREILEAINNLTDEQLENLHYKIKSK